MQPRSIQKSGNYIRILWEDDHQSALEIGYLRRKCPCVMCKNSEARTPDGGIALPSFASQPTEVTKIQPVGRYAVQFTFSDGHDTGIYSYDHLRNICPCTECAKPALHE